MSDSWNSQDTGKTKKFSYALAAGGLLCFLLAGILLHSFKGRFGQDTASVSVPIETDKTIEMPVNTGTAETSKILSLKTSNSETAPAVWVVYVTGAVKSPGVFEVPAGSRVYKVLEAAGGFAKNADREGINLAALTEDGSHLHFPAKGENEGAKPTLTPSLNSKPSASTLSNTKADKTSSFVNINTAGQAELETLPGIGPKNGYCCH